MLICVVLDRISNEAKFFPPSRTRQEVIAFMFHYWVPSAVSWFPIQRVNVGFFLRLPQIRVYIIWFLSGFLIGWKKHTWHSLEIMIMKMTLASHPGTKNMWFANYKSHYEKIKSLSLNGQQAQSFLVWRLSLNQWLPLYWSLRNLLLLLDTFNRNC